MNEFGNLVQKESDASYVKVTTHSGMFNVDEVVACAIIYLYANGKVQITRTDKNFGSTGLHIRTGRKDYDLGEAIKRSSAPCFCAGIAWKTFGKYIISSLLDSNDVKIINSTFNRIDNKYIIPIDLEIVNSSKAISHPFSFINLFTPIWEMKLSCDDLLYDDYFFTALDCARQVLFSAIFTEYSYCDAQMMVIKAFKKAARNENFILELPYFIPWEETVIKLNKMNDFKVYFVSYPLGNGTNAVYCIPFNSSDRKYRIPIPKSWIGLSTAELKNITGVSDILYCSEAYIETKTKSSISHICSLIGKLMGD